MSKQVAFSDAENAVLAKFEVFCKNNSLDDCFDELDWYALSIGYFVASGITDTDRLNELAVYARYDCGYWV